MLLACWAAPLRAEVRPYTLDIPSGDAVSFQLEFRVDHPGTLVINAEWSGPRVLSFRLERTPGKVHRARRSGPSPQRIEIQVDEWDLAADPLWTLSIRALAGRGSGSGLITLELPDAPWLSPPGPETEVTPPSPAFEPEPWAMARRAPKAASEQESHLYDMVETFRRQTVDVDGAILADTCRWRGSLLRYLAGWRDQLTETGEIPPISSRRYLRRLVEAVRRVDEVRDSDDPILAGPVPEGSMRKRAWLAVRQQRIDPLERELDSLMTAVRGGHAPELAEKDWPGRLISCVAACERHFEQRVRLGAEQASNYDIASAQWDSVLTATDALEALVYLTAAEPEKETLSLVRDP